MTLPVKTRNPGCTALGACLRLSWLVCLLNAALFFFPSSPTAAATVIDGTIVNEIGSRFGLASGELLIITNGGVLEDSWVDIAMYSWWSGNQAVITGTNSEWQTGAWMYLGEGGPNNSLAVSQGALVSAGYGIIIGAQSTSTGNTLQVVDNGNLFAGTLTTGGGSGSIVLSNGVIGVSSLGAPAFTFASGSLFTTNGAGLGNGTESFVVGTVPSATSIWNMWGGINSVAGGLTLGGAIGASCNLSVFGANTLLQPLGPFPLTRVAAKVINENHALAPSFGHGLDYETNK
jgi:T5SS/PEP-CTERM-associated repeat protein